MCGYVVLNADKKTVAYAPSSEKVSKLLSSARDIMNYLREYSFNWGDPRYNPAVNSSDRLVSCDRFVGWALYNAGYTDQPSDYGLQLPQYSEPGYKYHGYNILQYFKDHNFKKITNMRDLRAGDIVLLDNENAGHETHIFIYVSANYRYDGGNDRRWKDPVVKCTNPYGQTFSINDPTNASQFLYAYRIPD